MWAKPLHDASHQIFEMGWAAHQIELAGIRQSQSAQVVHQAGEELVLFEDGGQVLWAKRIDTILQCFQVGPLDRERVAQLVGDIGSHCPPALLRLLKNLPCR